MKRGMLFFLLTILTFSLAMPAFAQDDLEIRIGSKDFSENQILAWMIYFALEDAGYEVRDRINLGQTDDNRRALLTGDIDVYPEYTATGVFLLEDEIAEITGEFDPSIAYNSEDALSIINTVDGAVNNITWLTPAPGNNTYVMAVSEEFASENGIYDLEELAEFINDGNVLTFSLAPEFFEREDGWPTFPNTYDFEVPESQIQLPGNTPDDTMALLDDGEVDVAMSYGTAGVNLGDFVILEDVNGAQPIYRPTPVFRSEIIAESPRIIGILNPIFEQLDERTLQRLDATVTLLGDSPRDAASDWLEANDFITGD